MLDHWPSHSRIAAPAIGALLLSVEGDQALVAGNERELHAKLLWFAVALVIAYWLERDTRRTQLMRAYERGAFFFVGWPIVLPYYLIKARGTRRGLTIMLKWIGACIAIGVIVFLLHHITSH